MAEKLMHFGPHGALLGVLTEPAARTAAARTAAARAADVPAVLLLNAGVLHRVGPFGWYVELARRLAALGFPVLRFDLAGIGDSPRRADDAPEVERALADIRSALDHLASLGVADRFVLLGLCSGAMFAHHAAVRDARVAGVVFLDGYGYRTLGYRWRYYLPRLRRWSSWVNLVRRTTARLLPRRAPDNARRLTDDGYFLEFPPRAQVRTELGELLARGTALLFLYSGGLATQYFNDARQFREMYGDLDPTATRLAVVYDPRADHLYCDLTARAAMLVRVEQWLSRFASSTPSSALPAAEPVTQTVNPSRTAAACS